MTDFSVLLSLYAKEKPSYLREALESVFRQSVAPSEVILVEDGVLTPELYEVVEDFAGRYDTLKVVKLPVNKGLGKALNEGLKHCSYDLVARMDTDDVSKPHRFERQLEAFETHPEYDVVSGSLDEFIGTTDNVVSRRRIPELHHQIMRYGRRRNPVNHPVVMFRKKAVEAAGEYQDFPLFEDYYLWVRMLLNGSVFHNLQESLLFFRSTPDMYKRRGGLEYACNEMRFQRLIHRLGYTNKETMWMNIFIRFNTRLIPNGVRSLLYRTFLRKK